MNGYKGFKKGMICNPSGRKPKQYAENTIFEEDSAVICHSGMHFCENPFDVLDFYPLIDENGDFIEVAEVEALDEVKTDDNKKFCTKKLKIGAKLNFSSFIQAAIDFIFEKTEKNNDSGDWAQIGSSGDGAQIGSSGDGAKIGSSGYGAVIAAIGLNSMAKGKKGSWITLAEYAFDEEKTVYVPVCVKTRKIDGKRLKEDTFYKLVDGKFQEVGG